MQEFQGAQGGGRGVDDMQPGIQCRAEKTARIDDMIGCIDSEIQRQHMDRLAPVNFRPATALVQHPTYVRLGHRSAADRPLDIEQPRFRLATAQVDNDGPKPRIGHILSLTDAGADRFFRRIQVRDVATAETPALLPAEPQNPQRAIALHPPDQACDFGRTDIDDAERAGPMMPRRFHFWRTGVGGR